MSDSVTEANTSRFLESKGAKIHYHEAGEGPPIVLVPGLGMACLLYTSDAADE